MGMLSFAKNIGKNLFNNVVEASDKIKSYIKDDNPGINNLEVTVEDDVVSISGEAESAAALEKAVLMAGNVKGITEVRSDAVNAPAPTEKIEYYEIVSGDTLSAVAKKYYGNSSAYMRIFEANREVIKNPDKIYVGQKIRIPLD